MSKKIPYSVLQEAWAAGTNALRRKAKKMNLGPYDMGYKLTLVIPGDMKEHHLVGLRACLKVIQAWMKKRTGK